MDSHVEEVTEVHAFASKYLDIGQLEPVTADASFRSYWRVYTKAGKAFIIMHSPKHLVDVEPFVTIGRWLRASGIPVPEIFQEDESE